MIPYAIDNPSGLVFWPDMQSLRDRVSSHQGTNDGTDYVSSYDSRDIVDAGDEIDFPNIAVLTDITIAMWVRMHSVAGTQRVIQLRGTATSAPLLTLSSGRLVFQWIYSTTPLSATAAAGHALSTDTWTHIAVTRTGDLAANVHLYTHGSENTKSSAVDGVGTPIVSDGQWVIGNTLAGTQPLNGEAADIRVYNRVLSDSEIQQIRSQGLSSAGTFTGSPRIQGFRRSPYVVVPRTARLR